ncbi:MAG: hypothetical protein AAGF12_36705 [Myxococcota bacterium]
MSRFTRAAGMPWGDLSNEDAQLLGLWRHAVRCAREEGRISSAQQRRAIARGLAGVGARSEGNEAASELMLTLARSNARGAPLWYWQRGMRHVGFRQVASAHPGHRTKARTKADRPKTEQVDDGGSGLPDRRGVSPSHAIEVAEQLRLIQEFREECERRGRETLAAFEYVRRQAERAAGSSGATRSSSSRRAVAKDYSVSEKALRRAEERFVRPGLDRLRRRVG